MVELVDINRMAAVSFNDASYRIKQMREDDWPEDVAWRMKRNLKKFVLKGILETAFQLRIQCTLFAISRAVSQGRSDWQMLASILIGLLSSINGASTSIEAHMSIKDHFS